MRNNMKKDTKKEYVAKGKKEHDPTVIDQTAISKKLDLSKKEDLSIAVIHLINTEDHLAFTAMKTGREEYLEILDSVRELRKKLLKRLVTNTEGEMWCVNKHLLAATMRLLETGERCIGNDDKEAKELFKDAFDIYSLFWFLQKLGGSSKGK